MKELTQKYGKESLTVLFGLAVWLFWNNLYWGHLQHQELLQMFLFDADYWNERISVVGGFADYIAEFLTQFNYIRPIGALIMAILFVLLQQLVWRIAKKEGAHSHYYPLSFLPAMLLWCMLCHEDSLLSLPIALLLTLATIRIYQLIQPTIWKNLYSLLAIPVLYWLAGPVHFVFTLWLVLTCCTSTGANKGKWMIIIASLLIAGLAPYITSFYLHYPLSGLFRGLNYFRTPTDYPLWIPLSAISFALIPWLMRLLPPFAKQAVVKSYAFGIVLFAAAGFLIWNQTDAPREEVFQYHQLACRNDWERIIAKAEKKSPTEPLAVNCLNLALGKTGQLTSRMFHFYQNTIRTLLPVYSQDFITPIVASEVCYQLGMINEAQRYAFEGIQGTLNYRKSARVYKRLAETNLINGNYKVAKRYLAALQKTIYYKGWATRTMEFVNKPELVDKHPEWKRLRQYRFKNDFLFSEQQMPAILLQLFYSNSDNTMALEYLYAHLLLAHEFKILIEHLSLMNEAGYKHVPRSIQEAVVHYWRENYDDYSKLPFRVQQPLLQEMEEFARTFNFAKENKQQLLESRFGKTYWYYLFRISK